MKIAEKIRTRIEKLPKDKIFGYDDLGIKQTEYQTAAKALERLVKKDIIRKVSKGLFYLPVITIFGALGPNEDSIIKKYLYKDGKRIAYLTGISLYNQMNLTTQMSFVYEIASKDKRINIDVGKVKIRPAKSYVEITDDNFQLLGLLDAIKDVKRIPDTPRTTLIKMFISKIKALDEIKIKFLIELALEYPPRVRALLGALLEQSGKKSKSKLLKQSLNPLSVYKFEMSTTILPNRSNWNII